MIIDVKGRVFTGSGVGRIFTQLPWVREQINAKLGFDPYPGTLNLLLPSDKQVYGLLDRLKGWEITPRKGYFPARFYKALIMGKVIGAVVRPKVPDYPNDVLEIVAPLCLREELHLKDGDEVELKIWLE